MAQDGKDYGKRPGVVAARLAYLYGVGDGKPVVSTKRLAEIGECTEKTILRHIPEWHKEKEELIVNAPETTLGLALSAKDLSLHKSDMCHLRQQIQQVKWELDTTESITAKLEGWMDKFNGEDGEQDKALRILEAWQRNCGQKSSLRSQFLALQKQWTSLSGIVDMKDIQVVKEKTIAVGKAKLDLKKLENESGVRDVSNPLSGVFKRD